VTALPAEARAQLAVASAVRMLSEREAAFSVHQLGKTALDLGLKGVTVDHVERRIEQLVGRGQLIAGEARIGDTRPRLVTTQEALRTEERILDAVQEGRGRLARPRPAGRATPLQAALTGSSTPASSARRR
jgi:hypothetical protein